MRKYKDLIKELGEKGIKPIGGDFYDYEGFPLEEEFHRFYEYCQEYLDRNDLGFKIAPARFYYNTSTSENALAYVKNGYSLIEIFKGAIFQLHTFYSGKKNLFERDPLTGYEKMTQKAGVDSAYLIFQFVTLFFLYHEVGHLIQRIIGSKDYTEFVKADCTGDEVKERHMREHDADWFAAGQLAFHVVDFAKRSNPKDDKELVAIASDMTAMALAGVYTHFIRWSRDYAKVYYEEHCHPHPSVRLSYIIIYLLETMDANLPSRLDQKTILKNAIRISEVLMMEGEDNIIEKYSMELYAEMAKVEDYINQIRKNAESYQYLSRRVVAK